jgi:Tol biopolymer transport system component
MPLTPGSRLGPYEIVAPLGVGGMGEVYRARDTRLGRDVAVKVLPQHLSANPEVRARFEREARTISSLNHPHICTLHDVGREGETDYLVMELVDGETLAERLKRGPLSITEVARFGAEIADALHRAHRAGVVHRDLKPGNIMITKSGTKLMDFGLARGTPTAGKSGLAGPASGSGVTFAPPTQSPTVAQPLTAEGTIVGTFQYMAPEQLEGREADARSDLWALGCVLYEMATGRRAFDGATQASLISSIMRDSPRPMAELAPMSPPALERLVSTLLAKDPDDRVQTAHDVKLQLQWAGDASSAFSRPAAGGAVAAPRARRGGATLAWGVAGAALVLAIASWLLPRPPGAGGAERARLTVPGPPGARLLGDAESFAISPDGRTLAFVASDSVGTAKLWLRPLDGLTARQLQGTDRASQPFWSPDGRSLGFFADTKLKTIRIETGRIEALCDAPDPRGGAWGSQGSIVFAPIAMGSLYSVPSDGGAVTEVLRPDTARGETALRFPEFLPDGRGLLFVALPQREGDYQVYLGHVGSNDSKALMLAGAVPVYAEPGWLVTLKGDRLVALRFDAGRGKMTGKPVVLGDAPILGGNNGTPAVSASRNGVLAYPAGRRSDTQLAWLDRSGRVEHLFSLPTGRWEEVSISPDGRRALVSRRGMSDLQNLWLVDLATGQATLSDMKPSTGFNVIWSPDGKRVVYGVSGTGPTDLFMQEVDGGEPDVLFQSNELFKNSYGWSPDGSFITFESPSRETGWDLWKVPVYGDRRPVPMVRTQFDEGGGWFSPDGRSLIYYSDESGLLELYVRSLTGAGSRQSIPGTKVAGFTAPSPCWWSHDGREILMRVPDATLRVVDVEPGPTFRCGRARVLFKIGDDVVGICPTPDHHRFLATVNVEQAAAPAIVVDMNWPTALRKH